ncbi:hypothetical protein C0J52_24663 [Blattella germanica]|nr:hypothetical protein C0J52_24663 [Blattella germanica]
MESFYSLLFVMGVNSLMELENNYLDIVGKLPVEISNMILRRLDARSLISAAMVSRRWLTLCRSDLVLSQEVRAELRRQRTARMFPTPVRVLRSSDNCQPFGSVNVQRTIEAVLEPAYGNLRIDRLLGSNKLNRKKNKSPSIGGQRKQKLSATCSSGMHQLQISHQRRELTTFLYISINHHYVPLCKLIMDNMDTITTSEHSSTNKTNHTSSSNPNAINPHIDKLYNCLDSGPYIVICKNTDDSKIQIHPMKVGKILYKDHPELSTKNIRKLGNYKFEIEFQHYS